MINRTVGWGIGVLSLLAIIVMVVSVLNAPPKVPPTPTPGPTRPPAPTATPDPCAKANIEKTIREFDRLSRQFSDSFVLAQNTPAAQLAPILSEMQTIRRSAEDYEVPACLDALKAIQLDFMNAAIDGTLVLYSSFAGDQAQNMNQEQVTAVVNAVRQRISEAAEHSSQYTIEMGRLLGVPVPTPTPLFAPLTPTVTATTTPA